MVIEEIESQLRTLDKELMKKLLTLLPDDKRLEWEKDAETELEPYREQMESEIYKDTLELGLEGILRERMSIRRISLYAT